MKLSAIILAMTTTKELFDMTSNCINSLVNSENEIELEIVIVESNKNYLNSGFKYPDNIKVIVPECDFNFHKFLNIGIKVSKGEYIALCNNDLIFCKDWFSEILKIKMMNPSIKSFSPSENIGDYSFTKGFELGYKIRKHLMGWCIVANREVFPKIGFLDETFDFYYADNDYAMTLKIKNVKHALVFNSHVIHLEKKSSFNNGNYIDNKEIFLEKYKIPSYLLNGQYEWILDNERNLSGFLKFYTKWGPPNLVYRKNKIADILIKYELGYFVKFLFKINKVISITK